MSTAADFPNMPPREAGLNETWAFLKLGIDCIMNERDLDCQAYQALSTVVYNYCTITRHAQCYENGSEPSFCCFCEISDSCALADAGLISFNLYHKLSKYLVLHLKTILQVCWDECLLNVYLSSTTESRCAFGRRIVKILRVAMGMLQL